MSSYNNRKAHSSVKNILRQPGMLSMMKPLTDWLKKASGILHFKSTVSREEESDRALYVHPC